MHDIVTARRIRRRETLGALRDMLTVLQAKAAQEHCDMLDYLIGMAVLECASLVGHATLDEPGDGEADK